MCQIQEVSFSDHCTFCLLHTAAVSNDSSRVLPLAVNNISEEIDKSAMLFICRPFNRELTCLQWMTPKPGCVVHVMLQQIASHGTSGESFLFLGHKTHRDSSFLYFNFKLFPAVKVKDGYVTKKEHNDCDCVKSHRHLSYYYSCCSFNQKTTCVCGGFLYCLKSHFCLITSLKCYLLAKATQVSSSNCLFGERDLHV